MLGSNQRRLSRRFTARRSAPSRTSETSAFAVRGGAGPSTSAMRPWAPVSRGRAVTDGGIHGHGRRGWERLSRPSAQLLASDLVLRCLLAVVSAHRSRDRLGGGEADEREHGEKVPVIEIGGADGEDEQSDCSGLVQGAPGGIPRQPRRPMADPQDGAQAGEHDEAEQRAGGVEHPPVAGDQACVRLGDPVRGCVARSRRSRRTFSLPSASVPDETTLLHLDGQVHHDTRAVPVGIT